MTTLEKTKTIESINVILFCSSVVVDSLDGKKSKQSAAKSTFPASGYILVKSFKRSQNFLLFLSSTTIGTEIFSHLSSAGALDAMMLLSYYGSSHSCDEGATQQSGLALGYNAKIGNSATFFIFLFNDFSGLAPTLFRIQ